ncbi:MAG: hypothetical protein CMD88_02280 [Gammaproteobacteria bacterium]|nr:hypothetical protein [Gammaproteobacteria bacterium]|tara:strand:- start:591 stop:1223 length:633 start_codon:yes stop_codon:yes gene_type:complete
MTKIINFKNVTYTINNKVIIDNINLNIKKDGLLVLLGNNGAGKTTILKLMAGILIPTSGTINLSDMYTKQNNRIGFVFQKTIFLDRTVEENLFHALYCSMNAKNKENYIKLIQKELDQINMCHLLHEKAKNLSIGEQQIVSMIRSIIINPCILFCDEPTSNLDDNYKKIVENIIINMSNKIKVIMITQDIDQANRLGEEKIVIKNGKLLN